MTDKETPSQNSKDQLASSTMVEAGSQDDQSNSSREIMQDQPDGNHMGQQDTDDHHHDPDPAPQRSPKNPNKMEKNDKLSF